jgi:hypothetical protein
MSLSGSQRRDQRRRLVVSWNRSGGAASESTPGDARRGMADYAAEALPERQPALATLLPTGIGGLALAAGGILSVVAAAIVAGGCETILATRVFGDGGRFSRTLDIVRSGVDLRAGGSLAAWLGSVSLLLAAVVALIVRFMRRLRRDDYRGRYRAWGWMASLFVVAACGTHVPLGRLFGAFVAEASGVAFGPGGIGWWIAASAILLGAVSTWAVLPLHERAGTAVWMGLCLACWSAAATLAWIGGGRDVAVVAATACWSLGSAVAAVAMLTAARSVIREVRGQSATRAARPAKAKDSQPARRADAAVDADEAAEDRGWESERTTATAGTAADDDETMFTDGSDGDRDMRHLSKAERKRLKKLARMQRAA